MKILMFYAPAFWFRTFEKVLDTVPERDEDRAVENAVVVFYHGEAHDTERHGSVLAKLVKNIKWLSGKFRTKNIVLHSFNHLSASKAPADFTHRLVTEVRERLENSGFAVSETPFGYLNEWKIHVAGESLAKVFKEL
ncbi:MAG: threonyl-tRNA synthetase editing domain-containing protein [Nitrospiraceae bacterium]|nr:MAG: threonyl-tRNA synthetase editing domain-containing protein [Nitrospiraceae bacterium]